MNKIKESIKFLNGFIEMIESHVEDGNRIKGGDINKNDLTQLEVIKAILLGIELSKEKPPDDDLVERMVDTTACNICSFLVFSPSHTVEQLNHVKGELRKLLQAKK